MTRLGFALSMLALVAAASWAYHINYRTKTTMGRIDTLRAQIAAEREAGEVLRIEWAYLNAPDRLARLVAMSNDRLGLVPMGPGHFDEVAAIPFRPPAPSAMTSAIVQVAGPEPVTAEITSVALAFAPLPPPRPISWRGQ